MNTNYADIIRHMLSYKTQYEDQALKLGSVPIPETIPMSEFFISLREVFLQGKKFGDLLASDPEFSKVGMDELLALNGEFFIPVEQDQGYPESLANPDHAVRQFGEGMGQLVSAIYTQFRRVRQHLIDGNYLKLSENLGLFFTLLDLAKSGNTALEDWKKAYRETLLASMESTMAWQTILRVSPEFDYYSHILLTADLSDPRYLYRYGIHITSHDIKMAEFLGSYPAPELQALAVFIVKSWVDGFVRAKKDYTKKRYANLIFPLGMERLGRLVYTELDRIGITPVVGQPMGQGINKQYSYDHRFDQALVVDRSFVDSSIALAETINGSLKDIIAAQAGPVFIELFGESPFAPESKPTALQLTPEQQLLWRELTGRNAQIYYKYYRRDEASFTIIAFPSPEIGDKFPEIFADTLKINLLDSMRYAVIQQKIIDVLDQAEYVHVKGKPGNDTDIMVKMHELSDPGHETNFENCVADVNIPVGEVFTSPVLAGTTGTLHVDDIYLGSLRYFNLKMHFTDGWVTGYSCTNFPDPAEGKKYIHQNLLLPHDTLPIGEFAIGTNTTAYQIARKYDILSLLPILIIEKMGPHFAIGDTCFSHEEDAPHPSFMNGKEMIAVDNEKSATRKDDPLNAYTQKHMDITLPYEMLESITAITKEGVRKDIIRDGRFTVPGTEELNIPLDEGW